MNQANFYPGPSRVYSNITEYIYEAYMEGYMSINHRSEQFMELYRNVKAELRTKLLIPEDYEIIFTSSATESWEIIAQSLTVKGSQHFFNGAFGDKWASYAAELTAVTKTHFGVNEKLPTGDIAENVDVLCVTHNETSNATMVSMDSMRMLRSENEGKLIAVDVTSSFGGVQLDYSLADIWYGSVQKCLGLPAGMGFMILSPKAIHQAESIGENKRYNSLVRLLENAAKDQTSYTPNVLSIYLLYRTQQASKGIDYVAEKLANRMNSYTDLFSKTEGISFLVENEKLRSSTVLALSTNTPGKIKEKALERGIILGSGYGPWKKSTFRIANFPALKTKEVEKLMAFFAKYY
ncbi:aminotransferase class V-fold PLP-dependent enzyme [Marinoscillum pacificum]|uniref:aminotransferase class V-fold PLP-dependent enzyme n=1 Tax=Marinoscillum pacificum TaxID=392723 RepID=UPI0021581A6E|nr:aminotransferase class V-fold PLP-dependent enzyme [Marinoscillum pacificum]